MQELITLIEEAQGMFPDFSAIIGDSSISGNALRGVLVILNRYQQSNPVTTDPMGSEIVSINSNVNGNLNGNVNSNLGGGGEGGGGGGEFVGGVGVGGGEGGEGGLISLNNTDSKATTRYSLSLHLLKNVLSSICIGQYSPGNEIKIPISEIKLVNKSNEINNENKNANKNENEVNSLKRNRYLMSDNLNFNSNLNLNNNFNFNLGDYNRDLLGVFPPCRKLCPGIVNFI